MLTVEFTVCGIPCIGLNGGPLQAQRGLLVPDRHRRPGRDRPLLERHRRQRRGGKRLRLVQGQVGPLLADHAARAHRGHGGAATARSALRGDDEDAEDRRRGDRGGGERLEQHHFSTPPRRGREIREGSRPAKRGLSWPCGSARKRSTRSAVRGDHFLGREVVGIGGEFDIGQPLAPPGRDCRRGHAWRNPPLFPRHDGVADMAQAVRGKVAVPGCQRKSTCRRIHLPTSSADSQADAARRNRREGATGGPLARADRRGWPREAAGSAAMRSSSSRANSLRRVLSDQKPRRSALA